MKTGKTPVLESDVCRRLIDSIPTDTVRDLRDRALIATFTYGFARVTAALHGYIAAAAIADDKKGWLLRTSKGHRGITVTEKPLHQDEARDMVRRRAKAAGIMSPIGNHSFRATGITAYLDNGGTLEHAQAMAAHESPRTTKLYYWTRSKRTRL